MTLRTRLLLHYSYLLALLLAGAASAAAGFNNLGRGIEIILTENFESVQAATDMLAALERQDSATLTLLLDERASKRELDLAAQAFAEALERAEDNITIAAERHVIARIKQRFAIYDESRQVLLAGRWTHPLSAYEASTHGAFLAVEADVWKLLEVNQSAMLAADTRARQTAHWYGVLLGALVILASASVLVITRQVRAHLLQPLAALKAAAEAVAAGDTARRIPHSGEDELSLVARQLNAALDATAAIEGEMQGEVVARRQIILGLLAARTKPAALLALDGRLLASTLAPSPDHDTGIGELQQWLTGPGRARVAAFQPGATEPPHTSSVAGSTANVIMLVANDRRPVGWLAEI